LTGTLLSVVVPSPSWVLPLFMIHPLRGDCREELLKLR